MKLFYAQTGRHISRYLNFATTMAKKRRKAAKKTAKRKTKKRKAAKRRR